MELTKNAVKLDEPTTEINIVNGKIGKVKQDKLDRVYIWLD